MVLVVGLVAPHRPLLSDAPREQLKIRPRRAIFNYPALLVRLPRVFALARRLVHLGPPLRLQIASLKGAAAAEVHRAACSPQGARGYAGLIRATPPSEGPQ